MKTFVQFKKVGIPSDNEARLMLIEAKGDIRKAGKLCVAQRTKKVNYNS